MERFIFGLFYGLSYILIALTGGLFSLFECKPPAQALSLPLKLRFEHTHIVGGSGHGKTQLLQHMIATHDLAEVARGRRSLVVMDS